MKSRQETIDFLHSLQWGRYYKQDLEKIMQDFFETDNTLEDSTDEECDELDYAFIFTNGKGCCSQHFVDVEIYYLKMRMEDWIIITGAELLMYEE